MDYVYVDQTAKQKKKWMGESRLLQADGKNYKVEITDRGTYFHMIVGRHHYGNFIGIPNHDVGCELSTRANILTLWRT